MAGAIVNPPILHENKINYFQTNKAIVVDTTGDKVRGEGDQRRG